MKWGLVTGWERELGWERGGKGDIGYRVLGRGREWWGKREMG